MKFRSLIALAFLALAPVLPAEDLPLAVKPPGSAAGVSWWDGITVDSSSKDAAVKSGRDLQVDGTLTIPDMDDNLVADFTTLAGESTPDGTELVWVQLADGTWRRVAIGDWPVNLSQGDSGSTIGFVGVRAFNDANITLTDDTLTTLTLNSEAYDFGNIHSVSSETAKFTAPFDGVYSVSGSAVFAHDTTGFRLLNISYMGTTVLAQDRKNAVQTTGQATVCNVKTDIYLQEGEFVVIQARQNSGGPLDVSAVSGGPADGFSPSGTLTLWLDVSEPTTTKGDVSTHNGTNADRLAVGTDNQVLHSDSGTTTGIGWDWVNREYLEGYRELFSLSGTPLDTGDDPPGTVATSGTGADWSNPSNAIGSDDSRASATVSPTGTSRYIVFDNFGFSIPSTASIKGIVLKLERNASFPLVIEDESLQLLLAGVATGTDVAVGDGTNGTGDEWPQNTDATATYGSSTDVSGSFGLTPTYADVNDEDFGFRLSVSHVAGVGDPTDCEIDSATMAVYYETLGSDWHMAVSSTDGKLKIGLGGLDEVDSDPSMEIELDRAVNFPNGLTHEGNNVVSSDEIDSQAEIEALASAAFDDDDLSDNALNDLSATSLADPGQDSLMGWDDDDGQHEYLVSASMATDTTPSTDSLVPLVNPSTGAAFWTRINDLGVGGGGGGDGGIDLGAKGSLHTYDTDEAALTVGADGLVVTADSAEATGLKYASPTEILTPMSYTFGLGTTEVNGSASHHFLGGYLLPSSDSDARITAYFRIPDTWGNDLTAHVVWYNYDGTTTYSANSFWTSRDVGDTALDGTPNSASFNLATSTQRDIEETTRNFSIAGEVYVGFCVQSSASNANGIFIQEIYLTEQ